GLLAPLAFRSSLAGRSHRARFVPPLIGCALIIAHARQAFFAPPARSLEIPQLALKLPFGVRGAWLGPARLVPLVTFRCAAPVPVAPAIRQGDLLAREPGLARPRTTTRRV